MNIHIGFTQHEDRTHGSDEHLRMVRTAASHFATTGLRGTTISMLANAAGIPEGTFYNQFGAKERLFREAVGNNIDTRVRLLEERLRSIGFESETAAIERIAEATVTVCAGMPGVQS